MAYDLYRTGSIVLYLNPNVETRGSRFFCMVSNLAPAGHWSPSEDYKSPTGISLGGHGVTRNTPPGQNVDPLRDGPFETLWGGSGGGGGGGG